MHARSTLTKKMPFIIVLIMIISLIVLNSVFEVIHCNMRRDYKSIDDRVFRDTREKIKELEKEELKNETTIRRLADQYYFIGKYYLDRLLWDMAIEAFNNSLKYGNSNSNLFYSIGLAYGNRGKEKKSADDINSAEINYRKAIERNEDYSDAKYALSILLFYHRENGKEEAQNLINEILVKNRAYYPARFADGRFNYELGNKEKALTIYQELAADLDRLPSSGIINDYKKECKNNITRLMTELSMKQ